MHARLDQHLKAIVTLSIMFLMAIALQSGQAHAVAEQSELTKQAESSIERPVLERPVLAIEIDFSIRHNGE